MKTYEVQAIGHIETKEGFFIHIDEVYRDALIHLEDFPHIAILWWFSECDKPEYRKILTESNPYTNGPEILGTFASRSPLRPNPIALSNASIIAVDHEKGTIEVDYLDAMDGTPLVDIKPYTPSIDRFEDSSSASWCSHWPRNIETSGDFDWSKEFNF